MEPGDGQRRRLIVVLPEALAGSPDLAHKVYWMALREQRDVLYLALVDSPERSLQVSRFMAATAAQTSSHGAKVTWEVVESDRWNQALRGISRPGDVVACQAEQRVRTGWGKRRLMSEYLQEHEGMQVVTLPGLSWSDENSSKWRQRGVLAFLPALALLVLFTLLEFQVELTMAGSIRKVMLILLICCEAGAFYAWNRIN